MRSVEQCSHVCKLKELVILTPKKSKSQFFSLDKRGKSEFWGAIVGIRAQNCILGLEL